MEEFKTIASFNFVHEIFVLKSVLEHEEIRYFFQNENIISIDPLASYAYGGINLKVHPNDFERVQEILDELNTNLKNCLIFESCQHIFKITKKKRNLNLIFNGYYSLLTMAISLFLKV